MEASDSDATDNEKVFTPKSDTSTDNNATDTSITKVLIIGDSMTQGQEGDYTWRYRLWSWFRQQNLAIKTVGPYTGTMQPNPPSPLPDANVNADGGYATGVSPEFENDSYHYSGWGWAAWQMKDLISEAVATYQPDLVLCMLGFNDMGWGMSDAAGTAESIQLIVERARRVKGNVGFAVANVGQRRFMDGREDLVRNTDMFNGLLELAVGRLSERGSKVTVVRVREEYACEPGWCPAGYDGLHPNALGEWQIARAFSKALVDRFDIGREYLEVPKEIPPRVLPVPENFDVTWIPGKVTATWDKGMSRMSTSFSSDLSQCTEPTATMCRRGAQARLTGTIVPSQRSNGGLCGFLVAESSRFEFERRRARSRRVLGRVSSLLVIQRRRID